MRTSTTLFGAKNIGFFEIYGVSSQTRGREVEPVRTRAWFCAYVFYGRPLKKVALSICIVESGMDKTGLVEIARQVVCADQAPVKILFFFSSNLPYFNCVIFSDLSVTSNVIFGI